MSGKNPIAYVPGKSWFHQMDPVSKMILVLSASLVCIFNYDIQLQLFLLAGSVVLAAGFSGVPASRYWAFGKVIIPFLLLLGVVFPFFYEGHMKVEYDYIIWDTRFRDLTYAGVIFGLLVVTRFMIIAVWSLVFVFTTHPQDIVQSLARKGMDYRMVYGPLMGMVFLPLFIENAGDVINTQKIREYGAGQNVLARWINRIRHLMFVLLVLGLRKAQTTAVALDMRGFGASRRRTFVRELREPVLGKVIGWASLVLAAVFVISRLNQFLGGFVSNWANR